MVVDITVAHARPVQHQRMIEQRAVAVGRRFQPLQHVGHQADVIGIDLRQLLQPLGAILVMRGRMSKSLLSFFLIL